MPAPGIPEAPVDPIMREAQLTGAIDPPWDPGLDSAPFDKQASSATAEILKSYPDLIWQNLKNATGISMQGLGADITGSDNISEIAAAFGDELFTDPVNTTVSGYMPDVTSSGQEMAAEAQKAIQEHMNEFNRLSKDGQMNLFDEILAGSANMIGLSVGASAVGLITRSPALAALTYYQQEYANAYQEALQSPDLTEDERKNYATRNAAVASLLEYLPARVVLKSGKLPFLNALKKVTVHEVSGEVGTDLYNAFDEWATLNPEMSINDFLAALPRRLAITAGSTLLGAGALGGASVAANKGLERVIFTPEERAMREATREIHKTLAEMMDDPELPAPSESLSLQDMIYVKAAVANARDMHKGRIAAFTTKPVEPGLDRFYDKRMELKGFRSAKDQIGIKYIMNDPEWTPQSREPKPPTDHGRLTTALGRLRTPEGETLITAINRGDGVIMAGFHTAPEMAASSEPARQEQRVYLQIAAQLKKTVEHWRKTLAPNMQIIIDEGTLGDAARGELLLDEDIARPRGHQNYHNTSYGQAYGYRMDNGKVVNVIRMNAHRLRAMAGLSYSGRMVGRLDESKSEKNKAVKVTRDTWHTLAHEFGHNLWFHYMDSVPIETLQAVRNQYVHLREAALSGAVSFKHFASEAFSYGRYKDVMWGLKQLGLDSNQPFDYIMRELDKHYGANAAGFREFSDWFHTYHLSFQEYVAEQMVKYIDSTPELVAPVNSLWGNFHTILRRLFKMVRYYFAPSETYKSFVDNLAMEWRARALGVSAQDMFFTQRLPGKPIGWGTPADTMP